MPAKRLSLRQPSVATIEDKSVEFRFNLRNIGWKGINVIDKCAYTEREALRFQYGWIEGLTYDIRYSTKLLLDSS